MAYDGTAAAAVVCELNEKLSEGSITKIAQPERDELLLTCKNGREQYRVTISANPSAPLVYLRDDNLQSPLTAPNFCMCLRKHIGGGRIRRIFQPAEDLDHEGLERIVVLVVEHRDEMGEQGIKYLVCELMGKYSNIILLDQDYVIVDSIRHVSHMTSSVREVLPGRNYFIPNQTPKANPRDIYNNENTFCAIFSGRADGTPAFKKLYMSITGLSPTIAHELLYRAGIDADKPAGELTQEELESLFREFHALMEEVAGSRFEPNIVYDGGRPSELSAITLRSLEGGSFTRKGFATMSEAIRVFYSEKEQASRLKSRAEDLKALLKTLTERASRKLDILEKQYRDTDKRDKYRIWGELINAYGYSLEGGEEFLECANYYDEGRTVRIPLDKNLSASENAVRYFNKYQKLKRTREAAAVQLKECRDTLYHLGSISNSLSLCVSDADFADIRREMYESGYIHSGGRGPAASGSGGSGGRCGRGRGCGSGGRKRVRPEQQRSKPMHFVSSDGIDIYVGRNNYQNEELDFKLADPNDWWFHAKNIPGSHVIAKVGNRELPDSTCLEAAALAAYYSNAGSGGNKVEVDYVKRRELRKVPGAAPGFVIYHTNYSIMIEPKAEI